MELEEYRIWLEILAARRNFSSALAHDGIHRNLNLEEYRNMMEIPASLAKQ